MQYDGYIHHILGRFKFEGKFTNYDLDGARQLLEKSYSNGLIKAGLYLCEFVYPKYPSALGYFTYMAIYLSLLTKIFDIKIS